MRHRVYLQHLQWRESNFANTVFNINTSNLVCFSQTCNEGRQQNAGETAALLLHIVLHLSGLDAETSPGWLATVPQDGHRLLREVALAGGVATKKNSYHSDCRLQAEGPSQCSRSHWTRCCSTCGRTVPCLLCTSQGSIQARGQN